MNNQLPQPPPGYSLIRFPVGWRKWTLSVAGVLICLYAIAVLSYVLTLPDIGLHCAFTPVVNDVHSPYLRLPQNLDAAQLKKARIVQVGSHPIRTWPEMLQALTALPPEAIHAEERSESDLLLTLQRVKDSQPDDAATEPYLARVGAEQWVLVQLRSPEETIIPIWCVIGSPPVQVFLPSAAWFTLKLGLFVVGALVFWKRPDDSSAAQFFLLCIAAVGAYMGGYHWSRIVTHPTLIVVFIVCGVLLPAVSLHFYLVFPEPKRLLKKWPGWTLVGVYGFPLGFLVVLLAGYQRVRWLFRGGASVEAVDAALMGLLNTIFVYLAVAALWYLASVVCLLHSFWTASDATRRNQVKWILLGAMIALLPIGYTLYLAAWQRDDFGAGAGTWPMFAASVCFTVTFAISITRYRLMQLDQIVSSGMVYFLISSLAGLGYYGVVFVGMLVVGSQVMDMPSFGQALGVSSTALVLLLVLDVARSRLKKALDRRFYREKYQLDRTLRRMGQAIDQLVDPPTLARRFLQASADLLGVTQGAVYLREGNPPFYRLAGSLGVHPTLAELAPGCPLVDDLQARGFLALPADPRQPDDPAQEQLRFLGGEIAHALAHEGQLLALLILGPRLPGPYGPEDLNLVTAFAQITALALENAEGHCRIEVLNQDLRAKVEKISEQQRRILALQSQLRNAPALRAELASAASPASSPPDPAPPARALVTEGLVGSSPVVQQLLQLVRKVSASQSAVLLRGESGTGKELLAQAIHENSPRKGKNFVKVHCAALSTGLLESELFGHVKGAFTGAHRDKIGRFELANGGTLFLDEIGDISLEIQTKLLRVLQETTFERVGSSEPVQVDVRVIAATHQNLEELIRQGRFREDLFYRLNVISVTVPPLRERSEDIPELVNHFIRSYAQRSGRTVTGVDDDALLVLKAYHWPGNIRQLENVIERAVVVMDGSVIRCEELAPEVREAVHLAEDHGFHDGVNGSASEIWSGPLGIKAEREERDRQERERLVRALAAAGGNKAQAARALGLARSTLLSRLRKHGLS